MWLGGGTLYLYALGMGLPLMLITVFGNRLLPKAAHGWNMSKPLLALSFWRFPSSYSNVSLATSGAFAYGHC
jgi:thiol:disulfide interchange protein